VPVRRPIVAVAAALAAILIGESPAFAQAPRPQAPTRPAAAPAPGAVSECGQLPGGRAPVEKIAGLSGMSPRDLDLAYFGKPLADLTDEDFERISDLSQRCGAGTGILAADKLRNFESVVRAAQQNRRLMLDGIKKQMAEITAMPLARDKLIRLNELADRLATLEQILPRGDIKSTVSWIAKQSQALYDAAPKPVLATVDPVSPPTAELAPSAGSGAPVGRARKPGGEDD